MSDLGKALDVHDNHEPIDPDTLEILVDAARRFASLTSDETVERAARAYELANEDGRPFPYIVDDEKWADWWANGDGAEDLRRKMEAVLRSVEEGET